MGRLSRLILALLVVFAQLSWTRGLLAAETPSLRGVYNALGGTMSLPRSGGQGGGIE